MVVGSNITLDRTWKIGPLVGSGGFCDVHEATGESGEAAVVKLIPKEPGAERELLFESLSGAKNIIPIWESGETKDHFVLVMPKAEKSLRDHLQTAGAMPSDQTISILIDIAEGLASLESGIVHRDIKPNNILLYKGHWCLADFGIARYAESSTSANTRKHNMTRAYAAPEQWKGERATHATDMYAFGIVAFEMLSGARPFTGPDLGHQHMTIAPPPPFGHRARSRLDNFSMFDEASWSPSNFDQRSCPAQEHFWAAKWAPQEVAGGGCKSRAKQ